MRDHKSGSSDFVENLPVSRPCKIWNAMVRALTISLVSY